MRQICLFSLLLSNIVLNVLAREIMQENEIKFYKIGYKEVHVSLFEDKMIVYIENLTESIKKLLLLKINKAVEGKINTKINRISI